MMTGTAAAPLPFEGRRTEDAPGHWVLARLGKRVLRPGGAQLTRDLLARARPAGADVVELAPGLGHTARALVAAGPRSYTGVDRDPAAARIVGTAVAPLGTCRTGEAHATDLPDACADLVVGEAMLTMQTDKAKRAVVAEAVRLLRPGGRYAVHELGLRPDDLAPAAKDALGVDLARAIKVNARPLTTAEWRELLTDAGLEVEWVGTAPMALLELHRTVADEGLARTLRIAVNLLRDPAARRRVLAMRAAFTRHRDTLTGVAIVARRPAADA